MMCLFKPNTYDPKDWQCPKPSCRTVNFKKRNTCISCGARKPDGGSRPLEDWREGEKGHQPAWTCEACRTPNEEGAIYCTNIKCKKPSKEMARLMQEDKAQRAKDEGRGGGLYDRQAVEKKAWDSDEEEFDDFGRRKKKGTGPSGGAAGKRGQAEADKGNEKTASAAKTITSKQQAALERLRSKHAATGSRRDEEGRSRSRSRRRR
eukprot:TRINITY_DN30438_c0_g1_i1.p2 TRINITY_DN30438_c0_g1~~TRINITY_DN30438_c0_g1_i1.p2  ORF type:complete len:206 (+),score=54.79 TRINITY_DN30438_c0_g1_i1:116-733(+)